MLKSPEAGPREERQTDSESDRNRSGADINFVADPQTPTIAVSHNATWALGGRAAGQFLRFVAVVVMARLVGPDDVGLVTLALTTTGIFWVFADLGLPSATIQRACLTQADLTAGFWLSAGFGAALTLITAAVAPALGWFFGRADLVPLAAALGVLYLLNGLGIQHRTLLVRKMRFRLLAAVEVGAWIVSGIVGISVALAGSGPWALVAQPIARELIASAAYWVLEPWRPDPRFQPRAASGLLGFGSRMTGFGLVGYLSRNVDAFAVGRFLGAVPLGFYSRAMGLMMLGVNGVVEPMGAVLLPALSRLAHDKRRFQDLYLNGLEATCLLSVPLVTLGFLLAPEAVGLVYGREWLPAVPVLEVLCLSGLFQPLWLLAVPLFVAVGRADRLLRWSLLTAPPVVGAFLVGAQFGIRQTALAHLIVTLALLVPALAYAYRTAGVSGRAVLRRLSPIYTAAGASAVCTFAGLALCEGPAAARLGLGASAFSALYLLLLYWLQVPLLRRILPYLIPQASESRVTAPEVSTSGRPMQTLVDVRQPSLPLEPCELDLRGCEQFSARATLGPVEPSLRVRA